MWLAVLAVVLLLFLHLGTRKPRGFPPGPPRLPLVGFLPYMENEKIHKQLWRLSDTYGPVVGIFSGIRPVVVVNGWEAVKESLLNEDLNGRIESLFLTDCFKEQLGVMFTEKDFWREQRRFTLHQFRNFGFGKKSHEAFVHEEARELLQEIREAEGSISLIGMLGVSSLNILWAVLGGTRFNRNDPKLMDVVLELNIIFHAYLVSGGFVTVFPFLRFFVSEKHSFSVVVSGIRRIMDFCQESIKEHKATLDPDNLRDFFDVYLVEIEKQRNNPNTTFTESQLLAITTDAFMAGTETSSATVSFGIMLMALHPEIMRKVQEEVDEKVGRERLPCLEDKNKLVYTDATLTEVFRFRGAAPIAVPHRALRDTILQGCRIPAKTMVLVNIYSVHMDPDYWGDPGTFRPERFLNSDGSYRKDERHIPFGKGRRVCLGESLARMTSFILFTALLQNFTFSIDPAVPVPNTEGNLGFTLGPPDHRVFAKPRM